MLPGGGRVHPGSKWSDDDDSDSHASDDQSDPDNRDRPDDDQYHDSNWRNSIDPNSIDYKIRDDGDFPEELKLDNKYCARHIWALATRRAGCIDAKCNLIHDFNVVMAQSILSKLPCTKGASCPRENCLFFHKKQKERVEVKTGYDRDWPLSSLNVSAVGKADAGTTSLHCFVSQQKLWTISHADKCTVNMVQFTHPSSGKIIANLDAANWKKEFSIERDDGQHHLWSQAIPRELGCIKPLPKAKKRPALHDQIALLSTTTATQGNVAAIGDNRSTEVIVYSKNMSTEEGDCGRPLINLKGEVVGVHVAGHVDGNKSMLLVANLQ